MSTKVTREELYEQVWSTPMSRLAEQYGVSDVALAKTCKRLQIPRPGRGYWAQVAAGAKPKRARLPSVPANVEQQVFLRRVEQHEPKPPPREVPAVPIPRNLKRAHDAIRDLGAALASATPDKFDRLVVSGGERAALEVTVASHRRALLLLDGLAKALAARNHQMVFPHDEQQRGLVVVAAGEKFALSLTERLDRRDHELTPDEQQQLARGYRYGIPKYDYFADGRLQILLEGEIRRSWSDSKTRMLERSLGSIVLAVEDAVENRHAARRATAERKRLEEQQRVERETEQRRQRELEARAKHQEALRNDLRDMARRWNEAREVRAFLHAVERAVTPESRSTVLAAWLEWAENAVAALDPLMNQEKIAKRLEPDLTIATR